MSKEQNIDEKDLSGVSGGTNILQHVEGTPGEEDTPSMGTDQNTGGGVGHPGDPSGESPGGGIEDMG